MIEKSIFKDGANKNLTHPKTQKGITLIALIITIVIMLILVGVSVSVAINTGLFKTASGVSRNTQNEVDKEKEHSSGKVVIGGKTYSSLTDYATRYETLPEGITEVEDTTALADWDLTKVRAIEDVEGKIFPLPDGFSILEVEGKDTTVDNGIVIKDIKLGNEFVWVPVTNYENYTESDFDLVTDEDHERITQFYGNLFGTMKESADFDAVFTYEADSSNIQRSIVTYGGFYVGRYETTYDAIDEDGVVSGIGVKPGKDVLNAASIIKAGENPNALNELYYYRWWGLYKAQKDMYANNKNVGSLMISVRQWRCIMDHTNYGSVTRDLNTYNEGNKPDLSGSAYKDSNPREYDEVKNIYDLAGNVYEWAIDKSSGYSRHCLGEGFFGGYNYNPDYGYRHDIDANLNMAHSPLMNHGSRTTLYIKADS